MSFIREMANVSVTLGAFQGTGMLANRFLKNNLLANSVGFGAAVGASAVANQFIGDKSANEIKDTIRDRTVTALIKKGISEDQALEAFERHYDEGPVRKPGFFRTISNIASTRIMAGLGAKAFTALAGSLFKNMTFENKKERKIANLFSDFDFGIDNLNTNKIAKKAIVMFGALAGGYVGNKFLQGPSNSAYNERANDIVEKILAERAPMGGMDGEGMSQVEKLRMRDQNRGAGVGASSFVKF